MTTYRYFGRIIDKATKLGVPDLRIEAFACGRDATYAVVSAVTAARGRFVLEVSPEDLRTAFGSDVPILELRVRDADGVYAPASGNARWDARRDGSGTIEIDDAVVYAEAAGERSFVEGTVSNPDGKVPAGITVEVFGQTFTRSGLDEDLLGGTALSSSGEYHIPFEGAGAQGVYRRIRVAARDGATEVASRLVENPAARNRVHLVVGAPNVARDRGLTGHAEATSRLDPLLTSVSANLEDLTTEQIGFLATQTRLPVSIVERTVNAKKLSLLHTSLDKETFFGLLGDGVTPTSQGVFRHRIPMLMSRLQRAVASRTISPDVTEDLTALRADLETAALQALRTPVAGSLPIGVAVDNCPGLSTSPSDSTAFLKLLINHTGRTESFWDAVDASTALTSTAKTRLRFTMEACRLSGFFQPVVEQLHARIAATTLSDDPKALAAYTPADWRTLIDAIPSGPRYPQDTAPTDGSDSERRDNYAKKLAENVEKRFRTAVIRSRVASAESSSTLNTFFTNNASFELETHRVGSYLKTATDPFNGVSPGEPQDLLRERLHGIERLYRVTDRWEDTKRAMDAGYTSASAIDEAGREKFVEDMAAGATGDEKIAREARATATYDKACWTMAAATGMKVAYDPSVNQLKTLVTPDSATPQSDEDLDPAIADWTTLFGSPDSCACEHCRSVLGPAAYLADTLQLLKRVPGEPSGTARDIIFERRPDLPLLALSCANTDTALPYVDVVNEILEVNTAGVPWPATPDPVDTGLTSAELLAQPEIIYPSEHIAAYRKLEAEVYPFNLPFHVWQEEARIYLEHLGVRRAELLEVLAPTSTPVSLPRRLTLERLGTTGRQLDIITGPPSGLTDPPAYAYWDIAEADWPNDPDRGLQRARVFLEKAKISFEELRELLATKYCLDNSIELEDDAPCELDEIDIEGLDGVPETHRQFLHRFLRLRKVLGWSISDTGRAHTALGSFNGAAVDVLAGIRELQRYYNKLKPAELLSWFEEIDRQNTWKPSPSLFEKVFLNKRIIAPSAQAFEALFSGGSTSDTLNDVRIGLLAALRLSDADLSLLIDTETVDQKLAFPPVVPANETVTRANLSRLYRVTSFAKANKLKLSDFLALRELSGLTVLTGDDGADANPDGTLAFRKLADRASGIELTLEEMHYLIRHVAPEGSKLLLDPESEIATWRKELEDLVAAFANSLATMTDDDGSYAVSFADAMIGGSVDLIKLVKDPLAMTLPTATDFITNTLAKFIGGTPAAVATAVAELVPPPGTKIPEETYAARFAYLARLFKRYADSPAIVVHWFGEKLGVDVDVAQRLVDGRILTFGAGLSAVRAFIPGSTWTEPLGTVAEREDLLVRAHKAFLFAKKLELTAAEVDALYPPLWEEPTNLLTTTSLPAINWMEVPLTRPAAASATATERRRFELLLRAGELAKLRDRWPAGSVSLFDVFSLAATAPGTGVYDRIAAGTGWNRVELEEVAEDTLDLEATDFTHGVPLLRLEKALATIKRLGVPATTAMGWLDVESPLPLSFGAAGPNALTIAREIREAAGAKHEDEAWAAIARPLRNALREKQRDALVGHLLKKLDLPGPDQLYEQLLIDVQMHPCVLTSRLVAAHGSVQLFVQRIQLNLEEDAGLSPNDDLAAQWRWMKNYRVWEANRKVFLWPENWIEPELRGDKTPLFQDLEKNLLSGPISHETAEEAYRTYLDGLADLSNLQIVAVHVHKEENGNVPDATPHTVVHVFGRTRKSHKYYYRHREYGRWSAWEKLDVDVQGDHLMPFSYGGRLYLSWAIFDDVERTREPVPADQDSSSPTIAEQIALLQEEIENLDPENVPEDAVRLAEILVYELPALQQQQQQPSPPDISQPGPSEVESTVRLAVSERRHSGWTPPLESDAIRIGASPIRAWVSFLTDIGPGTVTTRLLFLRWEVGHFNFNPGTNVHSAAATHPLTAAIYQPQTMSAQPASNAPEHDVTLPQPFAVDSLLQLFVPPNTGWQFQGFRVVMGLDYLSLPLVESGTPTPEALILDDLDSETFIRAHRGPEPAGERSFLIMQDKFRTFTLDLRNVSPPPSFPLPPALVELASSEPPTEPGDRVYRFDLFFHPYVNLFRHAVASGGLDALLRPVQQADAGLQYLEHDLVALGNYGITENFDESLPLKQYVDFRHTSAYGVYNWELFFHAPFYVAISLTREGRYEEAQRWFHYIFDPTDGSDGPTPARFWKLKPFAENDDLADIQGQLDNLTKSTYAVQILQLLSGDFSLPAALDVGYQISQWRFDPFDPHMLARLRAVTYQKAVVMRYVDNLVQWADSLFAQDTIESINEATQLYVFALNILGPKPTIIPDPSPVPIMSYGALDATSAFDMFSNALVAAEAVAPPPPSDIDFKCDGKEAPPKILWGSPYFCVPPNEKLLGYWDTIADRLFKIRNCQNIEGVTRVLPLFQPPIDPALLVRAAALGISFSGVVSDLNVAAPHYRYGVLFGKAVELASSVASLGSQYLSVLEKGDAEDLSLLRQQHEVATQQAILETRLTQAKEARESLRATERSLTLAQERFNYYSSRELVSRGEVQSLSLRSQAADLGVAANVINMHASQAAQAPNATTGTSGTGGSPVITVTFGGSNLVNEMQSHASALQATAAGLSGKADGVGTMATYVRRHQDWQHQAKLASLEIAQIERQIEAGRIRVEIADHEAAVVRQQIDQSKEIERRLVRKFTNVQLYSWMKGELAAVYYQAYKLAYEAAKRAQKAYEYERGDAPGTAAFIQPGAWDNLRKGLLAGEKLLQDLRRLDAAYISQNKRELELVKTVSLAEHDPDQLVVLREVGVATFSLTEDDYDRDFPTHYLRRLKAVTATVPCTTGPYQGVLGTLTLFHGATRRTREALLPEAHFGAIQSIATSQGQSDGGVFELSFKDERLLPFEGAGAHSAPDVLGPQWKFALSAGNRFSFDTIDDFLLEVRYTARANKSFNEDSDPRTLRRLVRVRSDFPDAWQAYVDGAATSISMVLPAEGWAHTRNESGPIIKKARIYGWWSGTTAPLTIAVTPPGGSLSTPTLADSYADVDLPRARWAEVSASVTPSATPWWDPLESTCRHASLSIL